MADFLWFSSGPGFGFVAKWERETVTFIQSASVSGSCSQRGVLRRAQIDFEIVVADNWGFLTGFTRFQNHLQGLTIIANDTGFSLFQVPVYLFLKSILQGYYLETFSLRILSNKYLFSCLLVKLGKTSLKRIFKINISLGVKH